LESGRSSELSAEGQLTKGVVRVRKGRKTTTDRGSRKRRSHWTGRPSGGMDSGRRQACPQGCMRRPRLSTWRLFPVYRSDTHGKERTRLRHVATGPNRQFMHYRVHAPVGPVLDVRGLAVNKISHDLCQLPPYLGQSPISGVLFRAVGARHTPLSGPAGRQTGPLISIRLPSVSVR